MLLQVLRKVGVPVATFVLRRYPGSNFLHVRGSSPNSGSRVLASWSDIYIMLKVRVPPEAFGWVKSFSEFCEMLKNIYFIDHNHFFSCHATSKNSTSNHMSKRENWDKFAESDEVNFPQISRINMLIPCEKPSKSTQG